MTRVGAVGTAAGRVGNAATFTNSSTRLRTESNANLSLPAGTSGTVAGWLYPTSITGAGALMLSRWDGSDPNDFILGALTGGEGVFLVAATGENFTATSSTELVLLNNWNLLVGWYDHAQGTNGTVYIQLNNGSIFSTPLTSARVTRASSRTYISTINDGVTGAVQGRVDECAIWSRVLTPAERTRLWNSGNGLGYDSFNSITPRRRRDQAIYEGSSL